MPKNGLISLTPLTVLRLARGFSVRVLAARVGCTSDHLARVARGAQRPSRTLAVALAHELGVAVDALGLRYKVEGPSQHHSEHQDLPPTLDERDREPTSGQSPA